MHYTLLKYWVKLSLKLFYYNYQIVGVENIPKKGGVIFAANHQNAPMDAFNIICNSGREPYFATRGDLFSKEWMKKILLSLKMYPVFRLPDGREKMALNNDAFNFFSQKLIEEKSVGIFPEGAAAYKHQLLPLKKGIARLAFKALENNPDKPIYIIPTGLQYERIHDYQADLLIQYGKAILVNDYYDLYLENKARAFRKIVQDLNLKISELIIDIQEEGEVYEEINTLRKNHYNNNQGDLISKFKTGKKIIKNPNDFPLIINKEQKMNLFHLLFFPLLILGFLFHYPIRKHIDNQANKKTKDSQFLATNKFIKGLFFFPFYYAILALIIIIISHKLSLLFIPCIAIGGRWAYRMIHGVL